MRHHFHAEQWLPCPVPPLFAFFANPHNLPRLSDPAQKLRIEEAFLTTPPPVPTAARTILAGIGSHISLSFRPLPRIFVRLGWQLEIVDFEWNHHFTDEQRHGPFAFWQHTHSFAAETRSLNSEQTPGTLLSDDIAYELPLGALGDLAHAPMQRNLEAIFRGRRQRLAALLANPPKPAASR